MRKKDKQPIEEGTKRIVTKFLLFPKNIDGETRWLETATFEEVYVVWSIDGGGVWQGIRWIL